jgi:hypothetical protein
MERPTGRRAWDANGTPAGASERPAEVAARVVRADP